MLLEFSRVIEQFSNSSTLPAYLYSAVSLHFVLAIAEVYKNEGNDAYQEKDYSNAIHFYTEGIKVNCKDEELNAKLYNNRATAYFYLGEI